MKRRMLYAFAAVLAHFPMAAQYAIAGPDDVTRGRKVAEKYCSRCHVVGDYNPSGGISSTPSFQLLVRRRPDYKDRFLSFFARRPHPAFLTVRGVGRVMEELPPNAAPVEITEQDVKDVAAFVETLKPKKGAPKKPFVFRPRPKPRTR